MLKLDVVDQIEKRYDGDLSKIFSDAKPSQCMTGETQKAKVFKLIVKVPGDLHNLGLELVREDELFIERHLRGNINRRLAMMEEYADIWRDAMNAEIVSHRKQNAGRRAANLRLLRLGTTQ